MRSRGDDTSCRKGAISVSEADCQVPIMRAAVAGVIRIGEHHVQLAILVEITDGGVEWIRHGHQYMRISECPITHS